MTILLVGITLILFAYSVFATATLSEKQKLHEVAHKEVCKQDVVIKDYQVMYSESLQDNRNLREEMKEEREIKDQFIVLHQDYLEQRQLNKELRNKLRNTSEMLGRSESKLSCSQLPKKSKADKPIVDLRRDYREGSE